MESVASARQLLAAAPQGSDISLLRAGSLEKYSSAGLSKGWNERVFVLRRNFLGGTSRAAAAGELELIYFKADAEVSERALEEAAPAGVLRLQTESGLAGFGVVQQGKVLVLLALLLAPLLALLLALTSSSCLPRRWSCSPRRATWRCAPPPKRRRARGRRP